MNDDDDELRHAGDAAASERASANEDHERPSRASNGSDTRLARMRVTLRDCVADEVGAFMPWLPRRAHEIVAALCFEKHPLSMTEIVAVVGGSASTSHALIQRLEHAGVVQRRRERGMRHHDFPLRGEYPDVVLEAYVRPIQRVTDNNRARWQRALAELGDLGGPDAEDLRSWPDPLSSHEAM